LYFAQTPFERLKEKRYESDEHEKWFPKNAQRGAVPRHRRERRLTPGERKDWTLDQKRLTRWLLGLPKPVAILAADDARARQVLETCQLAGLNVPGDIALLGVDNDELVCENTSPTLSSIQPDFDAGGYEAASLLEQLMRRTVRMPQNRFYGIKRIVVRESSRFARDVARILPPPAKLIQRQFPQAVTFCVSAATRIACLVKIAHAGNLFLQNAVDKHAIFDHNQPIQANRRSANVHVHVQIAVHHSFATDVLAQRDMNGVV